MAYVEYTIDLLVTEIYTSSTSYVDLSSAYNSCALIDTSKFVNPTFYFEATIKSISGGIVYVQLYNQGTSDDCTSSGSAVSGSELSHNTNAYSRKRSGAITLTSGNRYRVQIRDSVGSFGYVTNAKIIVVDNIGSGWSIDEESVQLQAYVESTTSESYVQLSRPVYYKYESTPRDGSITWYFEVTLFAGASNKTVYALLYDITASAVVGYSEISTTSAVPTRVRSSAVTLVDGHEYDVRIRTSNDKYACTVSFSRIIIQQSGTITKTRLQKTLSGYKSSTSTSYVPLDGRILLTESNLPPSLTYYMETSGKVDNTFFVSYVQLYDRTSTSGLGDVLDYDSTAFIRKRTTSLDPTDGHEFSTQIKVDSGGTIQHNISFLIIDVSLAGGQTYTVPTNLNSLLKKAYYCSTFLDSYLMKFSLVESNLDSSLYKLEISSLFIDSLLSKLELTQSSTLGSLLSKLELTRGVLLESYLSKLDTSSIFIDSFLFKLGLTRSSTLDALLTKLNLTRSIVLDSLLKKLGLSNISVDALLSLEIQEGVTLDAVLYETVGEVTIDSLLDAILQTIGIENEITIDAILYEISEVTMDSSLDAILQSMNLQVGSLLDSILLKILQDEVTLDAVLVELGEVTIDLLLDVVLNKTAVERYVSLDSILFGETLALSGGCAGHALFLNTRNVSAGTDGHVYFYDWVDIFYDQGAMGYVYFYGDIFPPENIVSDYSFFEIPMFDTTSINYGSKIEQALANNDTVRYKYRLQWKSIEIEDLTLLVGYFISKNGNGKSFWFKHPLTDEYKWVRFDVDSPNLELFERDLYLFKEIDLIEVKEV